MFFAVSQHMCFSCAGNFRQHNAREAVGVRILLLHDTQHDLPAVETALAANGDEVRSMAEAEAYLHFACTSSASDVPLPKQPTGSFTLSVHDAAKRRKTRCGRASLVRRRNRPLQTLRFDGWTFGFLGRYRPVRKGNALLARLSLRMVVAVKGDPYSLSSLNNSLECFHSL